MTFTVNLQISYEYVTYDIAKKLPRPPADSKNLQRGLGVIKKTKETTLTNEFCYEHALKIINFI